MRILFNAGNLWVGGGIQKSVWFVSKSCQSVNFEYHYILSRIIYDNLEDNIKSNISDRCLIVERKKDLKRKIVELLEVNSYSLIFSMFGPLYFKVPHPLHVVGFANGWLTHSKLSTFNHTYPNIIIRLKRIFKQILTAFFIRQGKIWIVETDVAKNGLSSRALINLDKIFVISNSCGEHYFKQKKVRTTNVSEIKSILVFCSPHPNKNLNILPSVAKCLIERYPKLKFKFLLTLDESYFMRSDLLKNINNNNLSYYFENVGYVPIKDGPRLYDNAHCVFLPTLLETFSSVYPESFARDKDLITSNFDFAKDICQDAALYVDPLNPIDCAEKIKSVLYDEVDLKLQRKKQCVRYKDINLFQSYEDLFNNLTIYKED
ncbi:glycosyltransferase [Vibrio campbellii]|nr:glycosyltransferase [Vibrio campbellii]